MNEAVAMRIVGLSMLILPVAAGWGRAAAETASWTLTNGANVMANELVRLEVKLRTPFDGRRLEVREDGKQVAYQVEVLEGALEGVHKGNIWVCADLAANERRTYTVTTGGAPRKFKPKVSVSREGDSLVMDNGLVAVKLPAAGGKLAGPVEGVRLAGGSWLGTSSWRTTCAFNSLNPVVEGDGMIFGRVLLRYIFNDPNYGGPRVPFSYITVTLKPGRRAVEIDESFEMTEGSAWVLELGEGFRLKQRASENDLAATDQRQVIGVKTLRAEKWVRAKENAMRVRGTREEGVSFEFPAEEGARCWLLAADQVSRASNP
jgi:hypothetical protein